MPATAATTATTSAAGARSNHDAVISRRLPPVGPTLYRPHPSLADQIDYFGYWPRGGTAHTSRALPRGAATAVIKIGGRTDQLMVYRADGRVRLPASSAFIIGAGADSYLTHIEPGDAVITIHFRPAGALPFFGHPVSDVPGAPIDLAELWGAEAAFLFDEIAENLSAAGQLEHLETFLLNRMRALDARAHPTVTAALRYAERHPSMRMATAHELTGIPPKRFATLFRADVGLTPKTYFRVRRLQAALRTLTTSASGATVAADLGYFDQPHFVREFREFTGVTPTHYLRQQALIPGHIEL
jgi:AraC-like DNA-binding protein